jgi:hypothetical protein
MNNEELKKVENQTPAPDENVAPVADSNSTSNEDTHSSLEHQMKTRFAMRKTFSEQGEYGDRKITRRRTNW